MSHTERPEPLATSLHEAFEEEAPHFSPRLLGTGRNWTRHRSQEGFPTCNSNHAAWLLHCSIVLRIGLSISCGAANGCASAKQRVDFLAASLQRHCSDASPSAGFFVGAMFFGHAVVACTLVPLSESCGAMKVYAAHRGPRVYVD